VAVVAVVAVAILVVVLTNTGAKRSVAPAPAPVPAPAPAPARAQPPALPAPTGPEQFGANVNWLFDSDLYPPSLVAAQLQKLEQTGATVARTDALWERAEPAAPVAGVHHYDWSFDDAIATALAEHGLQWLAILDYTAPWALSVPGQDHSPPSSDAGYAAFAAAFAGRYGAGGSFWASHRGLTAEPVQSFEIWNEPDNPQFWVPEPDPAGYAGLYLASRAAIKAVDPGARVLIGGLAHPTAFLPALLSARPDLAGHIDGVAIHPYGPTPGAVLSDVRNARGTLRSLGLSSVPLYVTEFGWATQPPGGVAYAPATVRPGYISTTVAGLGHSGCGIAAATLYTWVTPERNLRDRGDWYGISPPSGGSSPGITAFAAGVKAASGPGGSCG
jgi:polysaccharide biosynthesis protein PslG